MPKLRRTPYYLKQKQKLVKSGYDIALLDNIEEVLANNTILPQDFAVKHHDHRLQGKLKCFQELHVKAKSDNWVVVYYRDGENVTLHYTGGHDGMRKLQCSTCIQSTTDLTSSIFFKHYNVYTDLMHQILEDTFYQSVLEYICDKNMTYPSDAKEFDKLSEEQLADIIVEINALLVKAYKRIDRIANTLSRKQITDPDIENIWQDIKKDDLPYLDMLDDLALIASKELVDYIY